jgi:TolB protein
MTTRGRTLLLGVLASLALAPAMDGQNRPSTPARPKPQRPVEVPPADVVLQIDTTEGDSTRTIIQRDLDYGDRITLVAAESASANAIVVATAGARFNYEFFAKLGASAVVKVSPTAAGMHVVIHDITSKRIHQVRDFALPRATFGPDWRLAVHGISDEIERSVTGTRGIAQSRILFVRNRRIHTVDTDGENDRLVAEEGQSLSPAWHPSGRYIAYTTLGERGTRIYIKDLTNNSVRALAAAASGLNITPAFSPDGRNVVYSHGAEEGTDLYIAEALGTAPARQITVGRGTDNVGPTYSPDGRRIAFTSGRSGHPEVYIMDADGTNVELLTPFEFGDQYYRSSADWSPDGRTVAFQSQINGIFQLFTIGLRDRRLRQLTSDGANEDPSWSPDGRHLVFASTRTGSQQLFVMDVESGRVRQLTRMGGSRLPAWSPALSKR